LAGIIFFSPHPPSPPVVFFVDIDLAKVFGRCHITLCLTTSCPPTLIDDPPLIVPADGFAPWSFSLLFFTITVCGTFCPRNPLVVPPLWNFLPTICPQPVGIFFAGFGFGFLQDRCTTGVWKAVQPLVASRLSCVAEGPSPDDTLPPPSQPTIRPTAYLQDRGLAFVVFCPFPSHLFHESFDPSVSLTSFKVSTAHPTPFPPGVTAGCASPTLVRPPSVVSPSHPPAFY